MHVIWHMCVRVKPYWKSLYIFCSLQQVTMHQKPHNSTNVFRFKYFCVVLEIIICKLQFKLYVKCNKGSGKHNPMPGLNYSVYYLHHLNNSLFWVYYASRSGNFLVTFRDNLSVPSSRSWPLKMRPVGCPETSVRNYHYSLRNNSE